MIFTLPGVPCIYYGDEIAMQGYRDPFNRAFFDWNSTEQRLRGPLKTLAALRRSCDAFDGGRLELIRAEGDVLHYRRVGKTQTAEIILNRGPHLIAEEAGVLRAFLLSFAAKFALANSSVLRYNVR